MRWLEVSLDTSAEAVDWARTMLGGLGYVQHLRITHNPSLAGEASAETPGTPTEDKEAGESGRPFTITFALLEDGQARARLDELERALGSLRRAGMVGEPRIEAATRAPVDTASFSAGGHRIGRRFVLLPADPAVEASAVAADDLPIRLAPTLSFGSGLHPATVLCLLLLEQHAVPGIHALDLGCGSGILSIALARLGATVLAVDNDRLAVEATGSAVRDNDVEAQVTVMEGSLAQGSQLGHWLNERSFEDVPAVDASAGFDLVVANILARVHARLAPDYYQVLRPGGLLITSGFTSDQEESVLEALAEAGLEYVDVAWQDDWVALLHRRAKSS